MDHVHLLPAARAGRVGTLPPPDRPVLQHEMRGHEPASALHQARHEGVGDPERRVRDDVKVAAGQAKVRCIGFDDDGVGAEVARGGARRGEDAARQR